MTKYDFIPTIGNAGQRHLHGYLGGLWRVKNSDSIQIGDCWMAGRLKSGDLLLCIAHTGDCFQDYILIKEYFNGLKGIPGSRFGSYQCGDSVREEVLSLPKMTILSNGQFLKNGR